MINQVASVSYLTAPVIGGVLYAAFGLKLVMLAGILCFFLTALLECFIKLDFQKDISHQSIRTIIKSDAVINIRFFTKEQPDILSMLLLTAASRFFVMGLTLVGLPFMVRNILGLSAGHYGAAESAMAVATIMGSIAAGLAFLLPLSAITKYGIHVGGFSGTDSHRRDGMFDWAVVRRLLSEA
ncbi:MAG: MFS transporter [Lachnospiraceae bacterium]|jgi:MFS family permease|nr:MFS transporter [Lachnospiraceae bacterium]